LRIAHREIDPRRTAGDAKAFWNRRACRDADRGAPVAIYIVLGVLYEARHR